METSDPRSVAQSFQSRSGHDRTILAFAAAIAFGPLADLGDSEYGRLARAFTDRFSGGPDAIDDVGDPAGVDLARQITQLIEMTEEEPEREADFFAWEALVGAHYALETVKGVRSGLEWCLRRCHEAADFIDRDQPGSAVLESYDRALVRVVHLSTSSAESPQDGAVWDTFGELRSRIRDVVDQWK